MHRIVVVGGGLAGHRAATALRSKGFAGELVVIGDEAHRPYDRPPLSKQVLAGHMSVEQCFFPVDDLDVIWKLGHAATGLDVERKKVLLANGEQVDYDGLVIATGRRAREWPYDVGLTGMHTLRSLDDAVAFYKVISATARVAIIGAGFIGCEVAATLRSLGVEDVTLIDVAEYPMPVLGREVGERAAKLHEQRGVRMRLGCGVEAIEGEASTETIVLSNGERLAVDEVLVAVGSQPNSEWLEESGLQLSAGAVLCDEFCFALGSDSVVAIGDIAAWPHPSGEGPICIEHWSNARDMADLAATNLLSSPSARRALSLVPTFWSDQYDVKIKSAGFLRGADRYEVVHEDPEKPSLVVEAFRETKLVGAIVFNKNRTIIDYQRKFATVGA